MTLLVASAFVLLVAMPALVNRYLSNLPVAPACPSCRSVARETHFQPPLGVLLPAFARTFLAECARCGWRGRMRWSLAPDQARFKR
jgi:hypothetical protein